METTLSAPVLEDVPHNGHTIRPVFNYYVGGEYKYSDFEIYPDEEEHGWLEHKRTLDQVKQDIDDKIEEQ